MLRSLTVVCFCFLFKQKTAYEMRISDWSSDVCSSDLVLVDQPVLPLALAVLAQRCVQRVVRALQPPVHRDHVGQIGRASCRERVCQYVSISVVAVSLKKKKPMCSDSSSSTTAHERSYA